MQQCKRDILSDKQDEQQAKYGKIKKLAAVIKRPRKY